MGEKEKEQTIIFKAYRIPFRFHISDNLYADIQVEPFEIQFHRAQSNNKAGKKSTLLPLSDLFKPEYIQYIEKRPNHSFLIQLFLFYMQDNQMCYIFKSCNFKTVSKNKSSYLVQMLTFTHLHVIEGLLRCINFPQQTM